MPPGTFALGKALARWILGWMAVSALAIAGAAAGQAASDLLHPMPGGIHPVLLHAVTAAGLDPEEAGAAAICALAPAVAGPVRAIAGCFAMWAAMALAMMLPCRMLEFRAERRRSPPSQGRRGRAPGRLLGFALPWLAFAAVAALVETVLRTLPMPAAAGAWAAPLAALLVGVSGFARPARAAGEGEPLRRAADGFGADMGAGLTAGARCVRDNGALMALMPVFGMASPAAVAAMTFVMLARRSHPRLVPPAALASLLVAGALWRAAGPP